MQNKANTDYPVHELIRERRSPRAFADRAVTPAELASVLEAARWSASCFNEQPWRFIVATKDEGDTYAKLLSCLTERNQSWAGRAPVLLLSVAATKFAANGEPNRHALHDVGLAMGQLTLQATSLGLCIHQMAGFDAARAREFFSIPSDFEPVAISALGAPGTADMLPEALADKERAPRERRPQQEFVFGSQWGKPRPRA